MNRYLIFIFYTFLLGLNNSLLSQDLITINIPNPNPLNGTLSEIRNRVFFNITNNTNQNLDAFLLIELNRTDGNNLRLNNESFYFNYPIEIKATNSSFTINSLSPFYGGFSFEDWANSNVPGPELDYIKQSGRIPPGTYEICMTAFNLNKQVIGQKKCSPITINPEEPPRIVSPLDRPSSPQIFTTTDPASFQLNVTWQHSTISDVEYELQIREVVESNISNARNNDFFETFQLISRKEGLSNRNYSFISEDFFGELDYKTYAIRLTASSSSGINSTFKNNGNSNIVLFKLEEPAISGCYPPNFNPRFVWPLPGDTLPFRDLYGVILMDPLCENTRKAEGQFIITSNQNPINSYTFEDIWPNGPTAFLRNFARSKSLDENWMLPAVSPSYAAYLPIIPDPSLIPDSNGYSFDGNVTFQSQMRNGNIENSSHDFGNLFRGTFYVGMPKPRLNVPSNDAKYRPNENIRFQFKTAEPPRDILPPFQIMGIQTGSGVENPYLKVKEKCVIQIAKDISFQDDSIVFSQLKKLQLLSGHPTDNFDMDDPNFATFSPQTIDLSTPDRTFRENEFVNQIFKNIDINTSFDNEDTLYWRVVWLKNPETVNVRNPRNLTSDMIYHSSEVRRLIITNNPGDSIPPPVVSSPRDSSTTNCETGCIATAPTDLVEIQNVSSISNIKVGHFFVQQIEHTSSSNGKINGTGFVEIKFLNNAKIKVNLINVGINQDSIVISGDIRAAYDEVGFRLKDLNDQWASIANGIDNGLGRQIDSFLNENIPEGRIVTSFLNNQPLGLPIGFDRKIDDQNLLFAITNLVFTGDEGAKMRLMYNHHFEELGADNSINLSAEICITPSGFGPSFVFGLGRDLVIGDLNGDAPGLNNLVIKGDSDTKNGTYLEFKCDCIAGFAIRLEATMDPNEFKKDDPLNPLDTIAKVKFDFSFTDENCNNNQTNQDPNRNQQFNFLVGVNFDPFQYKKFEGWRFTVQEAWLDMSQDANPDGFSFPPGYSSGITGNLWQGFYLKRLKLEAPKNFVRTSSSDASAVGVSVSNVLIDKTGFSASFDVTDILAIERGSADGWAFSIDSLGVKIIQNNFQQGGMKGKIGVPIQKHNDYFRYYATLHHTPNPPNGNQNWGFAMGIDLNSTLDMPAFSMVATLDTGSHIKYNYGYVPDNNSNGSEETISIVLNGNLNITGAEDLAAAFSFSGVNFRLGYNNNEGFYNTHFSFASPQKSIAGDYYNEEFMSLNSDTPRNMGGFPISIESMNLIPDVGNEGITAELKIDISVNFTAESDGGFSARTKITIPATYSFGEDNRFQIGDPSIDRICVDMNMSGIQLNGCVEFYKDKTHLNGIRSNGVNGNLNVTMPVGQVALAADFGATIGDNNSFRYFYVDGKVLFTSGIPLGAIQILGLGGGLYYNMRINAPLNAGEYDSAASITAAGMHEGGVRRSRTDTTNINPSGFNPIPYKDSYAFKLILPIASSGDPAVFNMDISVTVAWTGSEGLTQFSIVGDGYVMAKVTERRTAPIKLDVIISYVKNSDEGEVFNGIINVYIDYEIKAGDETLISLRGTTGPVQDFQGISRYIFIPLSINLTIPPNDGDPSFSFKIGSPSSPGGLNANILNILQVNLRFYLQAGNDIDDGFMVLPQLIEELLNVPRLSSRGNSVEGLELANQVRDGASVQMDGDRISGFKTGVSIEAELELDMFLIYASLGLAAGFDMAITKPNTTRFCANLVSGDNYPKGANGWYTEGRIYAGLKGDLGLKIDFFGERRFSLLYLGAAFMIQGGFPNPTYLDGRAGVRYAVLGGMISGRANLRVKVGSKCIPPQTDPFGFAIIAEMLPDSGSRDVKYNYEGQVSFAIPIGEEIEIPVFDESGEIVRTNILKAKIDQSDVKIKENGTLIANTIRYSTDNRSLTVTRVSSGGLSLDGSNGEFEVKVKAVEKTCPNCQFTSVMVNGRVWEEKKVSKYGIAPPPPVIPDDNLIGSMPVKNQRYHLQNASYASSHRYIFDQVTVDWYFNDNFGNSDSTFRYIARYQAYGDSPPIEVELKKNEVTKQYIDALTKPVLLNNTIYNVSIVRLLTGVGGVLIPRFRIDINPTNVIVNNNDFYSKIHRFALFRGDSDETGFIQMNRLRRLVPGSESNNSETVIFKFDFKTSKYNTIQEKLRDATVRLGNWGQVTVYGDERFDLADFTGYRYNPQVSRKVPLLGVFPDLDNPILQKATMADHSVLDLFTYDDLKRIYDYYRLRNEYTGNKDRGTGARARELEYKVDIWRGTYYMDDGDDQTVDMSGLDKLLNFNELNLKFNPGKIRGVNSIKEFRFNSIDVSSLNAPLSESDIRRTWDTTIRSFYDPSVVTAVYRPSVVTAVYRPSEILKFTYDVDLMVKRDFQKMYDNLWGLYNYTPILQQANRVPMEGWRFPIYRDLLRNYWESSREDWSAQTSYFRNKGMSNFPSVLSKLSLAWNKYELNRERGTYRFNISTIRSFQGRQGTGLDKSKILNFIINN